MAKKGQYSFDPFKLADIPRSKVREDDMDALMDEVADFVLDSVILSVSNLQSPVSGGKFKKTLSPEYKKKKLAEGGSSVPDLELTGDMLSSLRVDRKSKNRLVLTVDEDQQGKADNHNKFSSESRSTAVPERQFIPRDDDDQTFKRDIISGIRNIIDDFIVGGEE